MPGGDIMADTILAIRQDMRELRDEIRAMSDLRHEVAERLARMETRLNALEQALTRLISREEFTPVRAIAYGLAGGVLVAVCGAILRLVVK
jgi:septal ring factor EnvC (AmiA/AmiB activator)